MPDQRKLLAEVQRVVTDHGHVILVEFDAASALVRGFRILAKLTGRRCRFHTPASLLELLRASGLDAVTQAVDRATFVVIGQRRAGSRDALAQHATLRQSGAFMNPETFTHA